MNVLLCLIILLFCWFTGVPSAEAKQVKPQTPAGTIVCFSGGKEILRKQMVSGPFADEYKFAHEVRVKDETGEHSLNFTGGLCIIDRGVASAPELTISDNLNCYSGANNVVTFEVYGRETTVDEYVEGRTFVAQARGDAMASDSIHEYLVFGNEACIGIETDK